MGRTELILLITAVFLLIFVAGWVTRMYYGRIKGKDGAPMEEHKALVHRLHEVETALENREAEYQKQEWELRNRTSQAEAELAAAMEGLGAARRQAEELRTQLEAFR